MWPPVQLSFLTVALVADPIVAPVTFAIVAEVKAPSSVTGHLIPILKIVSLNSRLSRLF